jgi:hypothetical protein
MKLAPAAISLAALSFLTSAFAQDDFLPTGPAGNGVEPEALRLRIVPATPGAYQFAWWARSGRTYVPQRSTDLIAWESFPIIETGQGSAVSYGFTSESPRVFVRLRHLEGTFSDPYALDFDGDGLTNQEEFDLRSDPFDSDTDDDGLPDKWEVDHGLDPRLSDAGADADGDGISNLVEYQTGADPSDYYNGNAPVITTLEGSGQAGPPGHFLPEPWTVQVRNAAGAILVNAPVTFSVPAGQGGLAAAPSATTEPLPATLTVRTDALGLAWVYWKL